MSEISDEIRLMDAEGRLGGKRPRLICPLCGRKFVAGAGHLGSDYCLVMRTVKEQAAEGFVRCDHSRRAVILKDAGIEIRWLPGGLVPCSGKFRGVEAGVAPYVPRWAMRVMRATSDWQGGRARRVALLKALQLPELADVLEHVKTSRRVPHPLFLLATNSVSVTKLMILEAWKSRTQAGSMTPTILRLQKERLRDGKERD